MKHATSWSKHWKGSKQPRKQRKYLRLAPMHVRSEFLTSPVSKDLQTKHKVARLRVRMGDTVKIVRGQFHGTQGAVEKVISRRQRIFVAGAQQVKKDGSKVSYPIHPSNVVIVDLDKKQGRRFGGTKSDAAKTQAKSAATKSVEKKTVKATEKKS